MTTNQPTNQATDQPTNKAGSRDAIASKKDIEFSALAFGYKLLNLAL